MYVLLLLFLILIGHRPVLLFEIVFPGNTLVGGMSFANATIVYSSDVIAFRDGSTIACFRLENIHLGCSKILDLDPDTYELF